MELVGILAACLLSVTLVLVLWCIKSYMLTPVVGGKDLDLKALVIAKGRSESLEHTVRGLKQLKQSGKLDGSIYIVDAGMEIEAAEIAIKLSQEDSDIQYCYANDIARVLLRGYFDEGQK